MLICAFSETLRKPEIIDHYPQYREQTRRLFAGRVLQVGCAGRVLQVGCAGRVLQVGCAGRVLQVGCAGRVQQVGCAGRVL
jgi:hypothetical protein